MKKSPEQGFIDDLYSQSVDSPVNSFLREFEKPNGDLESRLLNSAFSKLTDAEQAQIIRSVRRAAENGAWITLMHLHRDLPNVFTPKRYSGTDYISMIGRFSNNFFRLIQCP